jgi:hypothetical protein
VNEREKEVSAGTGNAPDGKALAALETPKSVQIAAEGIRDDRQAAEFLSALIGYVLTQSVTVRTANTAVNGMGKLLKLVEMRQKYGDPDKSRALHLLPPRDGREQRRAALQRELAELDAGA